MNKYYKKLLSFLIKNQSISREDRELYEYAIKVVVHAFINILSTIIIGLFLGMLKESICLFFTYFILRKFSGGLHLNKYIYCLLNSLVLMILTLLTIKHLEQNTYNVIFMVSITFSTIFIFFFSPLDNENKKLTDKEKLVYRIVSVILSIVFYIVSVMLISKQSELGYSYGCGLMLTAVLLIAGWIKKFLVKKRIIK